MLHKFYKKKHRCTAFVYSTAEETFKMFCIVVNGRCFGLKQKIHEPMGGGTISCKGVYPKENLVVNSFILIYILIYYLLFFSNVCQKCWLCNVFFWCSVRSNLKPCICTVKILSREIICIAQYYHNFVLSNKWYIPYIYFTDTKFMVSHEVQTDNLNNS